MKPILKKRLPALCGLLLVLTLLPLCAFAAEEGASPFAGTFFALVPPIVAIALALITKEVYSSLLVGVLVGALLNSNFNPVNTVHTMAQEGLVAAVSDLGAIFIFLVLMGILVALINKTGASAAFGRWAQTHIRTRVGASLATFVLGILIFIDDYFNCLTVGSVMRPVTDSNKISRAKLAYLIDATAAPICMIAPVSTWAAAVSGYTSNVVDASGAEISSLGLFIRTIPYNFYSLLTLVFVLALIFSKVDFGPMLRHEKNAAKGDLFTFGSAVVSREDQVEVNEKGRLIDLILPLASLVLISVLALLYVGGYFTADSDYYRDFVGAFGDTDSSLSLCISSLVVLIFTIAYLLLRRLITFKEAMACVPKGFTVMIPSILILTLATALKNMTGLLDAESFVKVILSNAGALQNFLPAIIFVIACFISFATGTSWGTFGILIPIVLSVFAPGSELMIIGMSACLSGAVCGDHCSPISDTTIMSSAGAQCEHVNHVSTQLPYAITVALVSFGAYILTGFVQNWIVVLPIAIVLQLLVLCGIRLATKKAAA